MYTLNAYIPPSFSFLGAIMDKIKRLFTRLKTAWKRQNHLSILSPTALLGLLFFTLYVFNKRSDFFDRFLYELKRPFTWDTTMYYAIGKGMTQGLKPYVDMFETKPPMIFFISAISYSLTKDYYLCNLFSFFCLLLTTLAPSVCIGVKLWKKEEKNPLAWTLCLFASLAVGLLLGGYDQLRSGEVQVELFGAFFVLAYLLLARTIDCENAKLYSPKIIISALLLMVGVMFKEPFLLIAFAGGLIICKKGKDWLYRFILPCAYGGCAGVLLLAVTGTLFPYLTAYLPHMLGNHISIYGSPFERMKQFDKLLSDMSKYSPLLLAIVVISILTVATSILMEKTEKASSSYDVAIFTATKWMRILLAPLLVSFSVGLGGQYYNHHYIFALPCYALCVILLLEGVYDFFLSPSVHISDHVTQSMIFAYLSRFGKALLGGLTILSLVGIYLLPQPDYAHYEKILNYSVSMKEDAKYLDEVLDRLDEDTYQYFGFNGPIVYAYTQHNPLGPIFFQDPNNLTDKDSFFAKNLVKQMDEADVYVVSKINCGVLTDYVNGYITENFVLLQNSEKSGLIADLEKPSTFTYKIYVRQG